jgi:hypothetical protein
MADFCSLCEYGDINITELYNTHIKSTLVEDIKTMEDDKFMVVYVGGVCEHCGIVSIGVNNKFEAWGGYYKQEPHKFGHVDKETLELIINKDDPKYNEQRERAKRELAFIKFEYSVWDLYCVVKKIDKSELTEEDIQILNDVYRQAIDKILEGQ